MKLIFRSNSHPALSVVLVTALIASACAPSPSSKQAAEEPSIEESEQEPGEELPPGVPEEFPPEELPPGVPQPGPFRTMLASAPALTINEAGPVNGLDRSVSFKRQQTSANRTQRNKKNETQAILVNPNARTTKNPATRRPALKPFNPRIEPTTNPVRRPVARPVFSCSPTNRVATITGPSVGANISAGTTLTWARSGHDICSDVGIEKRYAIAVCKEEEAGNCNPGNGFYNARVTPEDLGWTDEMIGNYTLNADQIEDIRTKAGAANGDTVYFQIRYNYTNLGNRYGPSWDTRAFTFFDSPDAVPSDVRIEQAPNIFPPDFHSPGANYTASWSEVDHADYYRVKLVYQKGSASGSDFGLPNGESEVRETESNFFTFTENAPAYSSIAVWVVAACNNAGCGPDAAHGAYIQPMVPANPATAFSTIASAFSAPSCVNCHAVAANEAGFNVDQTVPYETGNNFGLPSGHVSARSDCTGCHVGELLPQGTHPVPWMAAPAEMDLRGKSYEELCEMARNPGSLADNIEDHLLGDPLILWAVGGGMLPQSAGNTDRAFGTSQAAARSEWEAAVRAWVDGGASCN